ncbi:hypothetical protein B0H12DRAFT_1241099 [Mycena haematopus]|nr:hypothetical protein B0H12DRAFT_1241099 [Mycena haematopus]
MLRNSDLHGYKIPGVAERAVVKMFADDTTVYLSERDSYEDLEKILKEWCLASGAKFNISKTEIIPFGTPTFRAQLLEDRRLNPEDEPIPGDVHVAKDGEAVRILGGFVGNMINAFTVWTPVLDKVDSDYTRWANLNPTMSMKKNIDQIIAGSRTQYLAQVNGMPAAVVKHVLKSQKEFINDGKRAMISREQLMAPKDKGGLGMLDLEARNEALHLMKTAALAETDTDKRAHWVSLASHCIKKKVVQNPRVADDAKSDVIVQNYRISQRAHRKQHKEMVQCLYTYGVVFKAVLPSEELQRKMPLWHHPGEDGDKRQTNNSARAKCLRATHAVRTVGEGVDTAARLQDPLHGNSPICPCDACEDDRARKCKNPHTCADDAGRRLDQLRPEWDPRKERAMRPADSDEPLEEDTKIFRSPREIESLGQGLRVITKREDEPKERPQPRINRRAVRVPPPPSAIVHIGSAVLARPNKAPRAAASVIYSLEDPKNKTFRMPEIWTQSTYVADVAAMLEAIRATDPATK